MKLSMCQLIAIVCILSVGFLTVTPFFQEVAADPYHVSGHFWVERCWDNSASNSIATLCHSYITHFTIQKLPSDHQGSHWATSTSFNYTYDDVYTYSCSACTIS